MEPTDCDDFEVRLKAALMLRRRETIRFRGPEKITIVGNALMVLVDHDRRTLVVRTRPIRCRDEELAAGMTALPGQPCEFADITAIAEPGGIVVRAAIDLAGNAIYREEMQRLRAEVELRAARIRREVEAHLGTVGYDEQ